MEYLPLVLVIVVLTVSTTIAIVVSKYFDYKRYVVSMHYRSRLSGDTSEDKEFDDLMYRPNRLAPMYTSKITVTKKIPRHKADNLDDIMDQE